MGKGDKKSKKGKRFRHSYGKSRIRKKTRIFKPIKKAEEKPKPVEHVKEVKPEPKFEKPFVVETKAEEVAISKPGIIEIKEEVQIPEIKETPVETILKVTSESKVEEIVQEESRDVIQTSEIKETPVEEIPEEVSETKVKKATKEEPKEKVKSEPAEEKSITEKPKVKKQKKTAPKKGKKVQEKTKKAKKTGDDSKKAAPKKRGRPPKKKD